MNLSKLFLELANVDKNGISRLVCVDEFKEKYQILKLGNGGSWCRFDGSFGKKYKIITIKNNGKISYSWNIDSIEKNKINTDIKEFTVIEKGNSIKYIKLCGLQLNQDYLRPIAKSIRKFFNDKNCIVCGSNHDIIIDHKNGLYNDKRVLNVITQKIEDFQVLCNHCNLQKRQTIKTMKETGKRYSALNISTISIFNVAFTEGDENYDENDPDWGKGTYWYDPYDFIKKCINNLK